MIEQISQKNTKKQRFKGSKNSDFSFFLLFGRKTVYL